MKKFFNYAISGLLLGVLLCSSLGIVQGGNSTSVHESDLLAVSKEDLPLASATSISVGSNHTCAVTTEGGVKCWGDNWYGQLGNDSTVESPTPVDVVGFEDEVVIAISSGRAHTCAVTSKGSVKCWGSNAYGQLGYETDTECSLFEPCSKIPMVVDGFDDEKDAIAISAGHEHTCALTSEGDVWCWGDNWYGQLGYDTTPEDASPTPQLVSDLGSEVVEVISAGFGHTCAVTLTGSVKCWGYNNNGQLGDGTTDERDTLVTVIDSSDEYLLASDVSAGSFHTCAITLGGGVKCWGDNDSGLLGDGTISENNPIPVDVNGLTSGVKAVSAGDDHTCALTSSGGVKCWGDNRYGKLGDGKTVPSPIPVDVSGLTSGVKAVSAGESHTCALTMGGSVKCWGENYVGQLGDGTTTPFATPIDVFGLTSGVAVVSADYQYTCALTKTGGVKCWGDKYYGQDDPDGDFEDTNTSIPVDVEGLTSGVKAIGTGKHHTCAITATDGVKCWGNNSEGQLGDGTFINSLTPVDVFGFDDEVVIAVTAGDYHTCALTNAGAVKCWGLNNFSQLGVDKSTKPRSEYPVDIVSLSSGVQTISTGGYHTCVITSEDGIKCWGNNSSGQLGNNSTAESNVPVDVTGLTSGVKEVSAGDNHTCAITSTDGVKCWGLNENGQLGDGTNTNRFTPVDVSGLSSGIDKISAGNQHTCVVTSSGTVKCWGFNEYGQLGDGTSYSSKIPVEVTGLSSGVKAVSAGGYHTCAITGADPDMDGIKCWGNNTHGQLGWKLLWVPVDVIGFVEKFMIYMPMIDR